MFPENRDFFFFLCCLISFLMEYYVSLKYHLQKFHAEKPNVITKVISIQKRTSVWITKLFTIPFMVL